MKEEKKVNSSIDNEKNENIKIDEKGKKKEKVKKDKHQEEILKLTELLGQEKDKSMRIQAEMLNFKRRKEEEVTAYKKYANEDILKELLVVLDNFERAFKMNEDNESEFIKGFKMIEANIKNILDENGVKEIEALMLPFDPNIHQAVLTEAREGVEAGIVIEVLQKGYMYKERVLRAAMVKVSE